MLYKKYHRNYVKQFEVGAFPELNLFSVIEHRNGRFEMVYSIKTTIKRKGDRKPLIDWNGKLCYTRNITDPTSNNLREDL